MSASTSSRPSSSSLVEVIDRILDKGAVIDIWARVSLVGIEILTVEARVVIASVDTFLHYAKEISKIEQAQEEGGLEELKSLDTSPDRGRESKSESSSERQEEVEIESTSDES